MELCNRVVDAMTLDQQQKGKQQGHKRASHVVGRDEEQQQEAEHGEDDMAHANHAPGAFTGGASQGQQTPEQAHQAQQRVMGAASALATGLLGACIPARAGALSPRHVMRAVLLVGRLQSALPAEQQVALAGEEETPIAFCMLHSSLRPPPPSGTTAHPS